jgi:addiction module HigA family antidote
MLYPDLPPIHPGEQLREEFMLPLGLTVEGLAQDIGVPAHQVQALIDKSCALSGDLALRLARYFGTTPEFWLNLQRDYELQQAVIQSGAEILSTVNPRAA